jgi:RNA polymerase sigma factor (sigma-70 family)
MGSGAQSGGEPGTVSGSDEDLMVRYVAGEENAFEQLYERVRQPLFAFFFHAFGSRPVAEDLLQLTFLRLHQSRRDYRPGLPLRPWLFSIARNLRTDEGRRLLRVHRVSAAPGTGADDAIAPPPPESRATSGDLHESIVLLQRIRQAMASLPDSQREVILMHKFADLSFDEIAEAVGASVSAVKVRAHRGYTRLRQLLEPFLAAEPGEGRP